MENQDSDAASTDIADNTAGADGINPLEAAFDKFEGIQNTDHPEGAGGDEDDVLSNIESRLDAALQPVDPDAEEGTKDGHLDGGAEDDSNKENIDEDSHAEDNKDDESEGLDHDESEGLDKDDKADRKWGELRGELKEAQAAIQAHEERVRQMESAHAAEREKLQAKLEEAEQELAVARVQSTPEYKQMVSDPMGAIAERATEMAEANGTNPEALLDALSDPNKKRQSDALEALLDTFSERDRVAVYRMAEDIMQIDAAADRLEKNAQRALEESESLREAQAAENRAKEQRLFRTATDRVVSSMEARLPKDLGIDLSEVQKHTKDVDFGGSSVELRAYSAAAGFLLPEVLGKLNAVLAENRTLKARAVERSATTPPAGGGNRSTASEAAKAASEDDGIGFLDRVSKEIARAGL